TGALWPVAVSTRSGRFPRPQKLDMTDFHPDRTRFESQAMAGSRQQGTCRRDGIAAVMTSRRGSRKAAPTFIVTRRILRVRVPLLEERGMSKLNTALLAGVMFAALLCWGVASAADDAKNVPDLMAGGNGWNSAGNMTPMPGSPPPVAQDPKYKYVGNNTNRRT